MIEPLISIAIPSYNGEYTIKQTLDSIYPQIEEKVEIVVSDDHSADDTYKIINEYRNKYNFMRIFRNEVNLGMDKNFEIVADLARGKYIWFSGQDDIFEKGAVDRALNVIQNNPDIDFIYMNYSQKSDNLDKYITKKMLKINADIKCEDYKEFLQVTGLEYLPSFLPSYIIRKKMWDKISKEQYYGTQYIQVGVLLALLKHMKTYIVAETFITGRIPDNGWQKSSIKLLDNLSGSYEVIYNAIINNNIEIPINVFKIFVKSRKLLLLSLLLRVKKEKKELNIKIRRRLLTTLLFKERTLNLITLNIPSAAIKITKMDLISLVIFKLYQWKNQLANLL